MRHLLLAGALLFCAPAFAQEHDTTTLGLLTLEEKAAQLQNAAPAEPKLDLPAYDWWNEGLHGLARNGEATVFPQAIGLAATWDPSLLNRIGDAVATEARAKFNARPKDGGSGLFEGLTLWSPNINIFRDPRWGRGQETYGEDPVLTARLAMAFIEGIQGPDPSHPKALATAKHLAAHSGPEGGRDGFSAQPSPRDMEATYLPAFRAAVIEGHVGAVMCAYNALHGTPACADRDLLVTRLRRDWGFTGHVVSDCGAVGNIHLFQFAEPDAEHAAAAALNAGTDLNCGGTYTALPAAIRAGLTSEARMDQALDRLLSARRALGLVGGARTAWDDIALSEVGSSAHRALALRAARKSIVLLDNRDDTLPLDPDARIAVFGPTADDLAVVEGNYHGRAIDPVTPLAGLRARFGDIGYAQGALLADGMPTVVPETALTSDGLPGLAMVRRDPDGAITRDRVRTLDLDLTKTAPFGAEWTGRFVPPGPGRYILELDGPACWHACGAHDRVTLSIDGETRIDGNIGEDMRTVIDGGTPVELRITLDHKGYDGGLRLRWIAPATVLREEALRAAERADTLVALVGLTPDLEGEALTLSIPGFSGGDRTEIALPPPQADLLNALAATGKRLVVVLTSGSALALGNLRPDAALAAWYPGVAGGTALADILTGAVNPSGRLPLTFYRSVADLPAFVDYNMKERTYRYFTGRPAWSFGHGLSYTRFAYRQPRIANAAPRTGDAIDVSVTLTNIGDRAGDEVVQLYILPPDAGKTGNLTDPVLQRQLAAFARVATVPGKARTVRFAIDPRAMSSVDRAGTRRVLPGDYRLWIGGGQPGGAAGVWTRFTLAGPARELAK